MDYLEDKGVKWLKRFDLQPMLEVGERFNIDPVSKLLTRSRKIFWDTPWDHINADPSRRCVLYQMLFNHKGFIPDFCLKCWKVVVKPRTLRELYSLRDMMRSMAEKDDTVYCKCGAEERPYVPGLYGGYFYTDSFDDGLARLHQVRELVNETIAPDVPVILKRYCTEFEQALGDSKDYKQPPDAKEMQELFYSLLEHYEKHNEIQPACFKHHVYHKWQVFGWKFGTPEDRKQIETDWNNGESYYPLPRTYEKGEY